MLSSKRCSVSLAGNTIMRGRLARSSKRAALPVYHQQIRSLFLKVLLSMKWIRLISIDECGGIILEQPRTLSFSLVVRAIGKSPFGR